MNLDSLTGLLEGMDIAKLIPDLSTFLGKLQFASILAILIGPLLMLIFGLWYLFSPPQEANHKAGFRTYFGMGSVAAWRYTQRIAGLAWGGLGAILTLVMGIVCLTMGGKDASQIAYTAVVCIFWQAVTAILSWLAITLLTMVNFDRNGNRRK